MTTAEARVSRWGVALARAVSLTVFRARDIVS
jgi:hypothetical protein